MKLVVLSEDPGTQFAGAEKNMKRILWILGLVLLASILVGAFGRLSGQNAHAGSEMEATDAKASADKASADARAGADAKSVGEAPKVAHCPVCAIMHGESEEEPVQATRSYEGKIYGFCSAKCAEEFDADPIAFLPPVLPRPAPSLALTTLGGDSLDWDALEDKVVLVDFWATWCKPCHKAMPELQALHDEYADRGFAVVGVSIDEADDRRKVEKFLAEKKIRYPIAIDSSEDPAWARYRVKAVPAAFLVDARGQIVAQWLGLPADAGEVEAAVKPLLEASSEAN